MKEVGKDYVYLVVGLFCWGKGSTLLEARRKARESGGTKGVSKYSVYLVPPSTAVNAMGDIEWAKEEGLPDDIIFMGWGQAKGYLRGDNS